MRGGYDLAIIGEAEETLTELFKDFSYDDLSFAYDIRGLAFVGDSGIVINPLRPVMGRLKFNSFFLQWSLFSIILIIVSLGFMLRWLGAVVISIELLCVYLMEEDVLTVGFVWLVL